MNYSETCNLWKYVRRMLAFVRIVLTIILTRDSKGFDRGLAAGEAIPQAMRQIAKININADEKLAFAA